MLQYHVTALYSGSAGNCYSVGCGESEILIDCGGSARALVAAMDACGFNMSKVLAVFITHEHIDHTHALRVLTKKYRIPIHITAPSADALDAALMPDETLLVRHTPQFSVQCGAFAVESFVIPHDSACCVAYRITAHLPQGGTRTLCVATDTGCVTDGLRAALHGADDVILESNHDENMLLTGTYPYDLKRRILSADGHLSNEMCGGLMRELADGGTRNFMLAHLSEQNNYPALALENARGALTGGHIPAEGCRIRVADRRSPVPLVELP